MYFNDFSDHLPYFLVYKSIFDGKSIVQWVHHIHAITCNEGMWCHWTRIELFYFDGNFCRIAQWVLAFSSHISGRMTSKCPINIDHIYMVYP